DVRTGFHLTQHDHLLGRELYRRHRVRRERIGRDVRFGRLEAVLGVGPDAPDAAQRDFLELRAVARRIAARALRLGEEVGAALRAARADELRLRALREPALDHGDSRLLA